MNRWAVSMIIATALGVALVPGQVNAATIYGTIRQDGKPVAKARVELVCGASSVRSQTDVRGTYRFTVNQTGRCELQVQGSSARVILYDEPTRYDFDVRQESDGRRLIRQ
jgi:hypothetical protein